MTNQISPSLLFVLSGQGRDMMFRFDNLYSITVPQSSLSHFVLLLFPSYFFLSSSTMAVKGKVALTDKQAFHAIM